MIETSGKAENIHEFILEIATLIKEHNVKAIALVLVSNREGDECGGDYSSHQFGCEDDDIDTAARLLTEYATITIQ